MIRFLKLKFNHFIYTSMMLMCVVPSMQAQVTRSVKVLEISLSGKSLILDFGRDDGIRLGSYLKVVSNKGTPEKPNMQTLGTLESVKAYNNFSFWIFRKFNNVDLISKGSFIKVIPQDNFLRGRRNFKIKQKKVILRDDQTLVEYLKEKKQGVPDDLIQEKDIIENIDNKIKTDIPKDADFETAKFDYWYDSAGPKYVKEFMSEVERVFIKDPEADFNTKQARKRERKRIFESGVKEVLDKASRQKNGLSDLYREQKRDKNARWFKDKISVDRYYDQYTDDFKSTRSVDPVVRKRVKEQGDRFSEDLDRSELRKYLITSGLANERRRQDLALDEKIGHELVFRYDTSLTENTNVEFGGRNRGQNLSISYEFQLGSFSNSFNRYTIDAAYLNGTNFAETSGLNAKFSYTGFVLGANFYFYNNPYRFNSALWYLGVGIGRSTAEVSNPVLETTYEYDDLLLPQWRLGMKYRFKSGDQLDDIIKVGVALNLQFTVDNNKLVLSDQLLGEDDLETDVTFTNYKLGVGMSVYF